jgi:hypothetical protein
LVLLVTVEFALEETTDRTLGNHRWRGVPQVIERGSIARFIPEPRALPRCKIASCDFVCPWHRVHTTAANS